MKKIFSIIDVANKCIRWFCSFIIVTTIIAAVWEVIVRYVFNRPTLWSFDYETLSAATVFVLTAGYVEYMRGHIRVDILYLKLNSSPKFVVDTFIILPQMLLVAFIIVYTGSNYAAKSISIWERGYGAWPVPFWPIKLCIPIGAGLLFLQVITNFLRDHIRALSK